MIIDDDKLLLKAAAKGDADAFGKLVIEYQGMVYNICRQSLRNDQDAEDVSQEVFIKAYKAIKSFRGDCAFSTWLYRITQNAVKDYAAKRSKRHDIQFSQLVPDDDEKNIDLPDEDLSFDPEFSAERRENINAVRSAISKLPQIYKNIIILRDIENYSYEQIAEMESIELGTVKSRLNRARALLKDILEKENFL